MQAIRIILLATLAAIAYGVVHDQVTARICVEYFTIGHPPVFRTTSPTLLALGWGILATWWVGLPLGLLLAVAARVGRRPRMNAAQLRRPIPKLLLVMAVCAGVAGVIGGVLAARGKVSLMPPLSTLIPVERQHAFMIDAWMHSASYLSGIIGGLVLVIWTWRKRGRVIAARG